MFTFTMGDTGTSPAVQPLESMGDRQSSEEASPSGSSLSLVAAAVGLAVQGPSLPAGGNPCQQQGTAAVEDKGAVGNAGGSHRGSGSRSSVESDADGDDTDCTGSVASSADLAFDNALKAPQLGNQQERNKFLWIKKCQATVRFVNKELSEFATVVLGSIWVGNVDVQSIIRKGANTSVEKTYESRFQAAEEYILAAEEYFTVQENARIEFEDQTDPSEMAEASSEEMAGSSSKDVIESMVVNQCPADTFGEMKTKSSREDEKYEMPEEKLKAKRRRLTSSSGEGVMALLKKDSWSVEYSAAGDLVNPRATQQEVTFEDMTNSRGEDERESVKMKGGAEKPGDQNGTSSKDNESDAVKEGHSEQTATNSSSERAEVRLMEADHLGEEACKTAQLIRKLVIRQRNVLSRWSATAESRIFRMLRESNFLLTCVKCAACVCKSALDAHRMAQLALKTVLSSATPVIVNSVTEAVATASQNTDMAVASFEEAVKIYMNAVSILDQAMAPVFAVQNDILLGEDMVREVTRAAEDLQQFVVRANVNVDEQEKKLMLMVSMLGTLCQPFTRAEDVNQITKQMAKKFDDAAFQTSVVAAVSRTTYFVLEAMTSAMSALGSLFQLKRGAPIEELSCRQNTPKRLPSVGRRNIPQDDTPVHQANYLQNAVAGRRGNSSLAVR